jgi:hypothetical protein
MPQGAAVVLDKKGKSRKAKGKGEEPGEEINQSPSLLDNLFLFQTVPFSLSVEAARSFAF